MRLLYNINQVISMLIKNMNKSLLAILCCSVGMFFSAAFYSYAGSSSEVYQGYVDSAEYSDSIEKRAEDELCSFQVVVTRKQDFEKLCDIAYLKQMVSFDEDIKVVTAFIKYGISINIGNGEIFKSNICYSHFDDDSGFFLPGYYDYLGGVDLSGEPTNSVYIAGHWLSRKSAGAIVGKEVYIRGKIYTTVGVMPESKTSLANIKEANFESTNTFQINFHVPNDTIATNEKIIKRFSEEFDVRVSSEQYDASLSVYGKAVDKSNKLMVLSVLILLFCLLNSFSLINAMLEDSKNKILVKLSLGARVSDILIEMYAYLFIILALSSGIATLGCFCVERLLVNYAYVPFVVNTRVLLFLVFVSLIGAAFMTLLTMRTLLMFNLSVLKK